MQIIKKMFFSQLSGYVMLKKQSKNAKNQYQTISCVNAFMQDA